MPLLSFICIYLVVLSSIHHWIVLTLLLIVVNTQEFINQYRTGDIRQLALKGDSFPDVNMKWALQQIAGYQRVKNRLPLWTSNPDIVYPPQINIEQCSSEESANYKLQFLDTYAPHLDKKRFVDLTGGYGVDSYWLSTYFEKGIYVEQNKELCEIAQRNFKTLGANQLLVINKSAQEILAQLDTVSLIYIDPARRSESGAKVAALEDCTPNILEMMPEMLQKSTYVLVKLSPMFDQHVACQQIPETLACAVVALNNECKELLLLVSRKQEAIESVKGCPIEAINIQHGVQQSSVDFIRGGQEVSSQMESCNSYVNLDELASYHFLYEPNTAIMKQQGFKVLSARYHDSKLMKLSQNSHLYVSSNLIPDFPGRVFKLTNSCKVQKREVRKMLEDTKLVHLAVRNFPLSADALRKKMGLKEGGDFYLFATMVSDQYRLLCCVKCD